MSTSITALLPELAPEERAQLPEDLTQYQIKLSLWRLTWQDMKAIRGGAGESDDAGMAILQKALGGVAVTLTSGERRALSQVDLLPFPLLAAAMKLLKKAMDEAMDPNG